MADKKKDEPKVAEKAPEPTVKPDPQGDIDQRMAALLEDHKRMGSR